MPKRKAEEVTGSGDEEDAAPVKARMSTRGTPSTRSKKASRREAIQRAKLAMLSDKQKVEASKQRLRASAKKSAPKADSQTDASTVETDESTTSRSSKTSTQKSSSVQATSAKRRRTRKSAVLDVSSAAAANEEDSRASSTNSSKSKSNGVEEAPKAVKAWKKEARSSRRKQIEEARARAKEWGEKQRAAKKFMSPSSSTLTSTNTKSAPIRKERTSGRGSVEIMSDDSDDNLNNESKRNSAKKGDAAAMSVSPTPAPTPVPTVMSAGKDSTTAVTAEGPRIGSPQFMTPMQMPQSPAPHVQQPVPYYATNVPQPGAAAAVPAGWAIQGQPPAQPSLPSQQAYLVYTGTPAPGVQSTPQLMQMAAVDTRQQPNGVPRHTGTFSSSAPQNVPPAIPSTNIKPGAASNSLTVGNGGSGSSTPGSANSGEAVTPTDGLVRTSSSILRQLPKSTVNMLDDEEDEDEDMPMPPTTELEKQISQQVMANCAAALKGQPLPFTAAPELAFSTDPSDNHADDDSGGGDDEPIVVDHDDDDYDPHQDQHGDDEPHIPVSMTSIRRFPLLTVAGVIATAVIGIVFVFSPRAILSSFLWPFSLASTSSAPSSSPKAPCFLDSYPSDADGYIPACNGQDAVECPVGGICEMGKLVACTSSHFEVSEDGMSCIPTKSANDTIDAIRHILVQWTIEDQCGAKPSETLPVFPFSDLQAAKPEALGDWTLERGLLDDDFVVQTFEDGPYVGLLSDDDLQYPLSCRLSKMMRQLLATVGTSVLVILLEGVKFSYIAFRAYPLISIIGLVVILLMRRRQVRNTERRKLKKTVAKVRQMSYDRLMEDPSQSHVVLHIRDEVAMELHPDSKKERNHLHREIWPRVVADVHSDNRVRKSTKILQGNQRDVWQWVAAPTKKSGSSRSSGGNKSVEVE